MKKGYKDVRGVRKSEDRFYKIYEERKKQKADKRAAEKEEHKHESTPTTPLPAHRFPPPEQHGKMPDLLGKGRR